MKISDVAKMTPGEKRVAVAKILGWRKLRWTKSSWPPEMKLPRELIGYPKDYPGPNEPIIAFSDVPDYGNSLDAMATAEQWLEQTTGHLSVGCKIRDYLLTLMEVCHPDPNVVLWDNGKFLGNWGSCVHAYTATASQRCDAFLAVMLPDDPILPPAKNPL